MFFDYSSAVCYPFRQTDIDKLDKLEKQDEKITDFLVCLKF